MGIMLESGKFYEDRTGSVHGPLLRVWNAENEEYSLEEFAGLRWRKEDGKCIVTGKHSRAGRYDLVKEVSPNQGKTE